MTKIELQQNGGNQATITLNGLRLYFSYNTCIGFELPGYTKVIRKNEWSVTTGKHLNQLDGGVKKDRVDGKYFEILLRDAIDDAVEQ